MDPRLAIINERLRNIGRIIAVGSGKGGVGKSVVSAALSLILSRKNFKVGLFDLDFKGPSCHLILGSTKELPEEEKGIIPPLINGVYFMTIYYYTGDNPLPLRGEEAVNVFRELLSITRWGELDYLIIDMPPGVGDETLELLKLIKRREILLVTTPSILSLNTVDKLVKLLKELKITILGMIENMRTKPNDIVEKYAQRNNIRYLGYIPFDNTLEDNIGKIESFLDTDFSKMLQKNVEKIL